VNEAEVYSARAQVAKLGMHMCVGFPAALLALGLILKKSIYSAEAGLVTTSTSGVLGFVFIAIALANLGAAWLVKRRVNKPRQLASRFSPYRNLFAKQVAAAYVPVLALAAAPALYGLLYYFLGGDQETYVLISLVCPLSYMAVRPRQSEIEAIAQELFTGEPDSDLRL
jgi:hypothetical protein